MILITAIPTARSATHDSAELELHSWSYDSKASIHTAKKGYHYLHGNPGTIPEGHPAAQIMVTLLEFRMRIAHSSLDLREPI